MTDIELKLNAWTSNPGTTVFCVQGEQRARTLHVTLIDRTGIQDVMSVAPVTPRYIDLTGYTPRMYVSKPDYTGVYFPGTVTDAENGKVDFTLTKQCVTVPGKAECTISLIKEDVELKIVGIVLDIRKSDADGFIEGSRDEFVELEVLTSQAKKAIAECIAVTERAEQAVEAANEVVQTDHAIVEDAKKQAASAKEAAASANAAAQSANAAVSSAETAAQRANDAAERVEGTDVGSLATELSNHISQTAETDTGVHGFRARAIDGNGIKPQIFSGGRWIDAIGQKYLLNLIYPIGSVYISTASSDPGFLLGGIWKPYGAGKVLVGLNQGDSDFDKVGKTGGEKTHTLSTKEMPKHTHVQNPHRHSIFTAAGSEQSYWFNSGGAQANGSSFAYTTSDAATNQQSGGDQPHNNMPPYIVVNMWQRTA